MIAYIFLIFVVSYIIFFYRNVRKYPKGPFPLPLIGNLYHEFNGRSHLPPDSLLQIHDQTGVLISDGEVWRAQRKTSIRILKELGLGNNLMESKVNRSIDEMLKQLNATNDGVTPFDMEIPLLLCIGNIINEILFGFHFEYSETERFEIFNNIVKKHMKSLKDNFYVLMIQAWPWAKYLPLIGDKGFKGPSENVAMYHKFIEEEVNKVAGCFHMEKEPTNFVEMYLAEMQKNTELDLDNLNAIAVDFWMAGMETTTATLKWTLLILMKNPEKQERIRAELLSVVGTERRIQMTDKPQLPYFVAAISELQKVANMISFVFFHKCTEDSIIGGKFIPKDTLTLPQFYSVLKEDPTFPSPEEFRPERFLDEDGKFNKKATERVIAFGMGKRQCLGEALSRTEIFLVLGTLLLNYRFEPIGPIDLNPIYGSILHPRPFKCRVVPL